MTTNNHLHANPPGAAPPLQSSLVAMQENKKLQKFLQVDRVPKKRIHALIEFLASSNDDLELVQEFWREYASTTWSVIIAAINELENYYLPHQTAFGKMKRRSFDLEDWRELIRVLQIMFRYSLYYSRQNSSWQTQGCLGLFQKLLRIENNPILRFEFFKLLVVYIDLVRPNLSGERISRDTCLELLVISIDFSLFDTNNFRLPRVIEGCVEGWRRQDKPRKEETLGMLKYVFDYSAGIVPGQPATRTRFEYWCQLIMCCYAPIFYPVACEKHGLKSLQNDAGFYNLCPIDAQKLVAQWIQILNNDPVLINHLLSSSIYFDILLETFLQRIKSRELVLINDILKLYHKWVDDTSMPKGLKTFKQHFFQSVAHHISQVFVSAKNFEIKQLEQTINQAVDLLELIYSQQLESETFQYIRQVYVTILNECIESTLPPTLMTKLFQAIYRFWMLGSTTNSSQEVWNELQQHILVWICDSSLVRQGIAKHLIIQWKIEVFESSRSLIEVLVPDSRGCLANRYTGVDQALDEDAFDALPLNIESHQSNDETRPLQHGKHTSVSSVNSPIILFDRMLHLYPPHVINILDKDLAILFQQSIHEIIMYWMENAIFPEAAQIVAFRKRHQNQQPRGIGATSSINHYACDAISTNTLLDLFQPWILPICIGEVTNIPVNCVVSALSSYLRLCSMTLRYELKEAFTIQCMNICYACLGRNDIILFNAVIANARAIFTRDLRGMTCLLPIIMEMIRYTCKGIYVEKVALSSVSLEGILYLLSSITTYDLFYKHERNANKIAVTKLWELQLKKKDGIDENVKLALREAINQVNDCKLLEWIANLYEPLLEFLDISSMLKASYSRWIIWGFHLLIIALLFGQNLDKKASSSAVAEASKLIEKWIRIILRKIAHPNLDLAQAAISSLKNLSNYARELSLLSESMMDEVLKSCCSEVVKEFLKFKAQKAQFLTIDRILELLDLIQAWSLTQCFKVECVLIVFEVLLQHTIHASNVEGFQRLMTEKVRMKGSNESLDESTKRLFTFLNSFEFQEEDSDAKAHNSYDSLLRKVTVAAQGLLLHLLHSYGTSTVSMGPTIDPSVLGSNVFSVISRNSMLISLVCNSQEAEPTGKIVIRDMTGLYIWEVGIAKSKTDTLARRSTTIRVSRNSTRVTRAFKTEMSSNLSPALPVEVKWRPLQSKDDALSIATQDQRRKIDYEAWLLEATGQRTFHHDQSKMKKALHASEETKTNTILSASIGGMITCDSTQVGVGCQNGERSCLDIYLEAIHLKFKDCSYVLSDKTLLGGKSTAEFYIKNLEENMALKLTERGEHNQTNRIEGRSFLFRVVTDEQGFSQLNSFLEKEGFAQYAHFMEAYRIFENATIVSYFPELCGIYWEYMTVDGIYPPVVSPEIRSRFQQLLQEHQESMTKIKEHIAKHLQTNMQLSRDIFDDENMRNTYEIQMKVFAECKKLFFECLESIEEDMKSQGLIDKFLKSNASKRLPRQIEIFTDYQDISKTTQGLIRDALSSEDIRTFPELKHPKISNSSKLPFDMCRLFVGHLNLLVSDKTSLLQPRQPSPAATKSAPHDAAPSVIDEKILRSIKHLDQVSARETMKIGVVYVQSGQRLQTDILRNTKGSPDYEHFIRELGWEVDLATHQGFTGGLDCNPKCLSNGNSMLYFADSNAEVAYHVVTMMPTVVDDPQQIDKKRHVGNNFVHIVWSENYRDYVPNTISSNLTDVNIVIYPFTRSCKDMYRIQIYRRDDLPFFGPLLNGMVISRSMLAALVRQTAMNATTACRRRLPSYESPTTRRLHLIQEMQQRYGKPLKFTDVLNTFFNVTV